LETGKIIKPRPETFIALGELNRRLAARDYSGISARALRPFLEDALVFGETGLPAWSPTDFWSCHVGLLEVPTDYAD